MARSVALLEIKLAAESENIALSADDVEMIAELHDVIALGGTGPCSLDMHPGASNWVQKNGGLPNYICNIAKDIVEGGSPVSRAIAIAVGRVKVWAAGGDNVKPDTRAKAAKAVAQWEALKAKAHAKSAVKGVKAATRAASD